MDNSIYILHFSSILCRTEFCHILEEAGEMLGILESEAVGNYAYVIVGGSESLFGKTDNITRYEFLRCVIGLFFLSNRRNNRV